MANRADVQMLQESIQHLGDTYAQRRQQNMAQDKAMQQLALERQMRDIQEQRSKSQEQHYGLMEARQQTYQDKALGNQSRMMQKEGDRADNQQQQAEFMNKQGLFKSVAGLNATGQLSPDARNAFNKWLSTDDHFAPTGLQIQEPDPKFQNKKFKEPAIVQAVKSAQDYRDQAAQSDDPEQQKQFLGYADMLESYSKRQGSFSPVKIPPTKVENIGLNASGKATNRVTSFVPPPAAPTPAPVAPQGGFVPPAPTSPSMGGASSNEVTRITPDGRSAIYDGTTKQFLRYAQ